MWIVPTLFNNMVELSILKCEMFPNTYVWHGNFKFVHIINKPNPHDRSKLFLPIKFFLGSYAGKGTCKL